MNLLIITDLHSQRHVFGPLGSALDRLRPDAVFCLGDLTDGARTAVEYTEEFLSLFEARGLPLLCISGNNDEKKSLEILEERGALLDYRERQLDGTRVVGIGYHPSESPFHPRLRDSVLLTHLPPRRNSVPATVTDLPRFHFSGHFHSREKIWKLRETWVVQVPTAQNYRAATLQLPRGWVEFIDLK
jgi:Icc-related predicted phosphoesterase